MLNCFTVKKKIKNHSQGQPTASPAGSLLDSQIDDMRHLSLLWSMSSQSSGKMSDDCQTVVSTTSHDSASPHQSNGHHSPQGSLVTNPDTLAFMSTNTWGDQSILGQDYVNVPATPSDARSPQKSSVTKPDTLAVMPTKTWGDQFIPGQDYVNVPATPSDARSPQKSSVTKPDTLAVVSTKIWDNQFIPGQDYIVMTGQPKCTTPGDGCPCHAKSNDTLSRQTASKIISEPLDKIIADMEKLGAAFDRSSLLSHETHSMSKQQLPMPPSANKMPALQRPEAATETDKTAHQKIQLIHNSGELQRILEKRKKIIDANDQAQGKNKLLPQQISAMEATQPLVAESFNIRSYPSNRTNVAVPIVGNGSPYRR